MTTFIYNNNMYSCIDRGYNELFKNSVVNIVNDFKTKFIEKKTFFIIKRTK